VLCTDTLSLSSFSFFSRKRFRVEVREDGKGKGGNGGEICGRRLEGGEGRKGEVRLIWMVVEAV